MTGYAIKHGQSRTWRIYIALPNGEYVELRQEWESEAGAKTWMRNQGVAYKGEEFSFA